MPVLHSLLINHHHRYGNYNTTVLCRLADPDRDMLCMKTCRCGLQKQDAGLASHQGEVLPKAEAEAVEVLLLPAHWQ